MKVDIFCITEHFLLEDMIEYYSIENFNTVSCFARSSARRGGSLIMCRSGLPAVSVAGLVEFSIENICEVAAVDLGCGRLRVVSVYRPPKSDLQIFLGVLERVLDCCAGSDLDVIIAGDFNVHIHTTDKEWHALNDLMLSFDFRVTIFEPTRGTQCLDNVFVNFDGWRRYTSGVIDPGLSDHGAVSIQTELLVKAENIRIPHVSQPLTEAGKVRFFNLVEQINWDFIGRVCLSVDDKFDMFINNISCALDVAFPTRVIFSSCGESKNYLRWFNDDLRVQRERLKLFTDLKKISPNVANVSACCKVLKKSYRDNITEARRSCYRRQVDRASNRNKAYWDIINQHRSRQNRTFDGSIDVDRLNEFFVNVTADIKSKIPTTDCNFTSFLPDHTYENNAFKFSHVTFIQVRDTINSIKNKNSRDHYGLSIALVKLVLNVIVYPLTKLINMSIDAGIYPSSLKIAKVVPIFKKGNADDFNNYRPISLVPTISKIYEHLLKSQIVHYFESMDLFYHGQFGFRRGRGTCNALLKLIETVVDGMKGGPWSAPASMT